MTPFRFAKTDAFREEAFEVYDRAARTADGDPWIGTLVKSRGAWTVYAPGYVTQKRAATKGDGALILRKAYQGRIKHVARKIARAKRTGR
jgi:hypothetical protein